MRVGVAYLVGHVAVFVVTFLRLDLEICEGQKELNA
jgi:hypothetical protein